jgi:hypothetical protein
LTETQRPADRLSQGKEVEVSLMTDQPFILSIVRTRASVEW